MKIELSETWRAVLLATSVGLPLYIFFSVQGDPERAMAAAGSSIVMVESIRRHWHLRSRLWFCVLIVFLTVVHAVLVVLIPWEDNSYPSQVLAPIGVIDLIFVFGCIKIVGKVVREPNPDPS